MKRKINELIKKHKNSTYTKYLLKCSVPDFKKFQRMIRDDYDVRDDWNDKGLWRHIGTIDKPVRVGTVKFEDFELNVMCPTYYEGEVEINEVKEIDRDLFKNSKR